MLKKLFHKEDRYDGHTVKTVFTVFGIKIKIKNYIETLKKRCENLENSFNENLINIFLELVNKDDLYFIQSGSARWIFSGKIKDVNRIFISDYLGKSSVFRLDLPRFKRLDKTCPLYNECKEELKDGKFLLRYKNYHGTINKTVLSVDANGDIYKETKILGAENNDPQNGLIVAEEPKRKIIDGVVLSELLYYKSADEIYEKLVALYDWMFSTFQDRNDKDKLSGLSPDCHFNNYLVSDGKFYIIDNEILSVSPVGKDYYLTQIKREEFARLTNKDRDLIYRKLLNRYGCEDEFDFYNKNPVFWKIRWPNEQATAEKNRALFEHYFSEASYLPQTSSSGD